MRKLIMKMSITIDGFVAGVNGEADWIFRSSDETSRAWSLARSYDASLIIMGRKSFEESMAPYWPTATGAFAAPMNTLPKAVFTKSGYQGMNVSGRELSPAEASWAEAKIFEGDLAEEIQELKAGEGKPILALGGAGFMQSLIATGLVDEYHLNTHPVILGAGLPIFTDVQFPINLTLIETKSFPGGIVGRIYSK